MGLVQVPFLILDLVFDFLSKKRPTYCTTGVKLENHFGKFIALPIQKAMFDRAKKCKRSRFEKPKLNEVIRYFIAYKFPKEEGEVFYFYCRMMSWRTESRDHLGDWKSAAKRWMWNLEN